MEKVLSISVACYNLGEMVLENLKSFCESSVADKVELIVTDDGSKDNSAEIVEKYAKNYPNTIKLIRQQNQGPGSTVNSGIKNATGKYFRMVDGDDWVDTKNLEEWVALLENSDADMYITPYLIYDNKEQKFVELVDFKLDKDILMDFDKVYKTLPIQMHAVTYKTELYQKNNIVLDNCFYTDVEYLLFPIPYVKTVAYFNKPIYCYRVAQAGQSVSPQSMIKNIAQHEKVFNNLMQFYNNKQAQLTSAQSDYISTRIASMADVQLTTYLCMEKSKENKQKIKQFFKDVKKLNANVYNKFKVSKKCRLLRLYNFALYGFVSKKIKQKIKA